MYTGEIARTCVGLVENCRNTGNVTSEIYAGGISGVAYNIAYCCNSGTVITGDSKIYQTLDNGETATIIPYAGGLTGRTVNIAVV